jgi:hypothetical protein
MRVMRVSGARGFTEAGELEVGRRGLVEHAAPDRLSGTAADVTWQAVDYCANPDGDQSIEDSCVDGTNESMDWPTLEVS